MSNTSYTGDTFHEHDMAVAADVAVLKCQVEDLKDEVEKLKAESEKMLAMANRWKGGGAALIALGTIAGSVFASWEKIRALFVKLGS